MFPGETRGPPEASTRGGKEDCGMSVLFVALAGAIAVTVDDAVEAVMEWARYRRYRRGQWRRERFN